MHNNDTPGKNWVYSISGQPVYPQTPQNKTPVPHEKTVREELEEQAKLLEDKQRQEQNMQITMPENYYKRSPSNHITPQYWETAIDGSHIWNNVKQQEGDVQATAQNINNYIMSAVKGSLNIGKNFMPLKTMNVTDKYKHALMNCNAAQYGQGGADVAKLASDFKEWYDTKTGANTLDSSQGDDYANRIGRLLGSKYPQGDCDVLIQKYIKKKW